MPSHASAAAGPGAQVPPASASYGASQSLVGVLGRTGTLLALTVALELWLMRITHLPQSSYAGTVLAPALARRLVSTEPLSILALVTLLAGAASALWYRSLGPAWNDFHTGSRLRWLITLTAAVLAWVFATYPYNHYFDQGHYVDRVLLMALLFAVAWRPVFLVPFLLVLLPIIWQFTYPIGGYSWAACMLLIRALVLMTALWLVRARSARIDTADFLFLLCCMVAAHYWVSGLGKLRLGWLGSDHIAFLLPATYASGWLAFVDAETIGRLTASLATLNAPLKLGTVLLECGALFALARPATLRVLLPGWIALHLGIFALTGICFWHWAVLDAAILLLFFRRGHPVPPIFTRPHFLVSLVLVAGGALWFRPSELAWLDARASYTYRLEARGESGRSYQLPPRFFAPYDYQFTLTDFRYLTDAPHLRITWGATPVRSLAAALDTSTTPAQVLALEAAVGRNAYDPRRSAAFDHFIQQFIGSWNEHGSAFTPWRPLEAPPLLWTFTRGITPRPADRITGVVVCQTLTFFDGERYQEIRTRPVRVIEVPRQR